MMAAWALRATAAATYRDHPNPEPGKDLVLPDTRRPKPASTAGRSAIPVRVKFTRVTTPLYPCFSLPELAWSELRQTAGR